MESGKGRAVALYIQYYAYGDGRRFRIYNEGSAEKT